jgi:hypothetical protein
LIDIGLRLSVAILTGPSFAFFSGDRSNRCGMPCVLRSRHLRTMLRTTFPEDVMAHGVDLQSPERVVLEALWC